VIGGSRSKNALFRTDSESAVPNLNERRILPNPLIRLGAFAIALILTVSSVSSVHAQSTKSFQYFYDDLGQLTKVIDSSGNEIDYTYDSVGNILQVTRGTAPAAGALAILDFTPQSGSVGTVVTIQGQNFSTTLASNAVSFNGAAATVLSANANTLTAAVPAGATTGPISVTVAGNTTTSTSNFTFIPSPAILSISPQLLISSSSTIPVPNFQVTGTNLTGATFSFIPAFNPPPIGIVPASISSDGTSAALNLTIAAGTVGSFALVATSSSSTSSQVPGAANTLQIVTPDGDADGDGLTNVVEVAIGTLPLNAYTSGDGLPDGWQVFYGLNPSDKTVAGKDLDASGLTVLQDFQMGLSPANPNLVPPSVTQVIPKNGATGVIVNDGVVVHFSEPLLTGTSLTAAQNAITAALGSNSTVSSTSQVIAGQTLQAYMNRTCCGNSVIAGTVILTSPSGAVAGTVTPSSDGMWATFSPSQPLLSNTLYKVQVKGVRDAAGNLMTTAFSSSFTTGSAFETALQIATTSPVNGASNVPTSVNPAVTFVSAIDPSSLASGSISILDTTSNVSIAGVVQVDPTDMIVSFVPSQPLTMGHFFAVTISAAIKDIAGNTLGGNCGFGFTTGPVVMEADSNTFSLLNSISPVPPPPIQLEADSVTFSLLNGVRPASPSSNMEADSLTFSLLNNSGPVLPPTSPLEVDSLTFSLLNGEPPAQGATVYEADSLTFSVQNTAPSPAAIRSGRDPAANSSGTTLPKLGQDSMINARRSGESLPMAPGKVDEGVQSPIPVVQRTEPVSQPPAFRPSAFSIVLDRLFRRHSQHKPGTAFGTQAAIGRPATRTHSTLNTSSNPTSAGCGEATPSPGHF